MRKERFELSRYCYRQPLKLVRLPVPPLSRMEGGFHLAAEASSILFRLLGGSHGFSCYPGIRVSRVFRGLTSSRVPAPRQSLALPAAGSSESPVPDSLLPEPEWLRLGPASTLVLVPVP